MSSGGAHTGPLRYQLLGPLRVRRAGVECQVGPAMQRAVLAVLLLNANEPVPREQIVQAVWGAGATVNSPSLVTTYVARLRRALEPERRRHSLDGVLSSHGAAYRLAVEPGCLDLQAFEAARLRAREQRSAKELAGCAATLDDALALWHGGGLDGLPGPYAALHRGRLAELRIATAEERFDVALLLGRHHHVVAELGLLAAAHPHRERLRGLLMLALYRAGRQSEALAVFAETRQQLIADLGLEPGRELDELHRRILATDPDLELGGAGPERAGPLRPLWRPAQLPSDLADFTGRAAETRSLCRILGAGRGQRPDLARTSARRPAAVAVAVLSGPPGVGKTALAVHAAHRLRERFPDGQLYAVLHGQDDRPRPAVEVLGRLLADLGVEPSDLPAGLEGRAALFRSVTWGRRLLLVLDDAEDEAQVAAVVPGSPGCAVLVTCRGRLDGLPGARSVALGCLAPGEAVRLLRRVLAEAGAGAGPGADTDTGPQVARAVAGPQGQTVLTACDGLPLALRVAAGWVAAHPGRGLDRLAGRLADDGRGLAGLSPGGRGVAAALGSAERRLRRAVDGPAAAEAFRRLSLLSRPGQVSESGDPRAVGLAEGLAVGAVAGLLALPERRVEELLDRLVEHGLLQPAAADGYRLHPLAALFGRATRWTPDGIRMACEGPSPVGRPG